MGHAPPAKKPLIVHVLQRYWRLTRGLTVAVAAIMVDAGNQVLLHKSADGRERRLPSFALRNGETLEGTLVRGLGEAGISLDRRPAFRGIHRINGADGQPAVDHLGLFVIGHWACTETHPLSEFVPTPIADLPRYLSPALSAQIEVAIRGRAAAET